MIFRCKRRILDEQVEAARAEAEKSRQALERDREHVVIPLARWRDRNHFADLIRASLIEGRGPG